MESESTQFFQFDKEGNMFVFAPGVGCTGPTRFVCPGAELIFNSSYNASEWATECKSSVDADQIKIPHTCPPPPAVASCEFKLPLPQEDLVELSHKNFSAETMKRIRWVRKMYHEWCSYRHGLGLEYIHCHLKDRATTTAETLKFALCHFITEVKKINGDDFPGKTLYHIVVCIQFHLEFLSFAFKIINDPAFKDLKFTLDNTMKAQVSQEIGLTVKRVEVFSAMDEDLLWSIGMLGMDNPDQLLSTVIFFMGKGFALCTGKEHRALHGLGFSSQFKFMTDSDGEIFLR